MTETANRAIIAFEGAYRWLSNFYPSPFTDATGTVWPTVEHYYQASKSTNARDVEWIRTAIRPGDAKRAGNSIIMRDDWELVKVDVMLGALRAKFAAGTQCATWLLTTNDWYLIEGNTWHDQFWGSCSCGRERCKAPGLNTLGTLIMQVRDELRAEWGRQMVGEG